MYVMYKCQNICIKNEDIDLSEIYILVTSKPSKTVYVYVYMKTVYI